MAILSAGQRYDVSGSQQDKLPHRNGTNLVGRDVIRDPPSAARPRSAEVAQPTAGRGSLEYRTGQRKAPGPRSSTGTDAGH